MLFVVSLIILVLLLGASLSFKGRVLFIRFKNFILGGIVLFVFGSHVYTSYQLYTLWHEDSFSYLFLPPHQPITYFLQYAGFRLFLPFFITLVFTALFFFLARFLNKRFSERFFESEEPYYFAFAFILIGYPGFLFYLFILFGAYLLFHLAASIISNRFDRLPFYHFWIPVALFVILLSEQWLQYTDMWLRLSFGKLG